MYNKHSRVNNKAPLNVISNQQKILLCGLKETIQYRINLKLELVHHIKLSQFFTSVNFVKERKKQEYFGA